MNLQQHFLTMALYHKWAYEKLNTSIAEINNSDYKKNCGLFFGSIHKTLNHLYLVDCLWYGRFIQTPSSIDSLDKEFFSDRNSLADAMQKQADLWIQFVETAKLDAFAGNLSYNSIKGLPRTNPFVSLLAHVFNHGTHHRGQISAAVTQLGLPAPEMDICYYLLEAK